MISKRRSFLGPALGLVLTVSAAGAGCAPMASTSRIPPAPIVGQWPEAAFLPERQCRGRYTVEELQPYLSRARLAMWLPSTRSVALDPGRRCITVTVESIGGGRLAELVIRSMAVPRRAVLLILAGNTRRG
jgi:hypothetical protein